MLSDESRMRIFTGNANPDLAREIAENLGTTVGDAVINRFNNGEVQVMKRKRTRQGHFYCTAYLRTYR